MMAATQTERQRGSPWAKALAVLALAGMLVLISALMSTSLQAQGSADAGVKPDSAPANGGGWFFKAGGWIDYAPNGVPDFDQKQDCWGLGGPPCPPGPPARWTYCGPAAAANSLWWFDSKFEPLPLPPSIPNDHYHLVTSYSLGPGPAVDDHDPTNVGGMGLIDDLAWYFDTDGWRTTPGVPFTGTEVHAMSHGLQWYLYGGKPWGLSDSLPYRYYDDYHVQLVKMPTWDWVVEEVKRSEDVILLLGFWELQGASWKRVGGHYVTVAGIRETPPAIAFSDPFWDNAEVGGPGRVLSGTILPHQPVGAHPSNTHNDAGNISHDYYTITLDVNSPAGLWEIVDYPYDGNFEGQNCPKEYLLDQDDDGGLPVFVEVEYALAMSPFYWKPGGEWVDIWWQNAWLTEFWRYEDDGDSCLPDFTWTVTQGYPFDGPVAAANSFWWFDSKAETLLTGGKPTPPPTPSDHYDLVTSYPPGLLDDHDPANIPPFTDDLAENYLDTGPLGTTIVSMTAGINAFLARPGVDGDFYTVTQQAPTWQWIADEVETSEDVILLLGFYEQVGDEWQRKGGHWVNAAGVSRANNLLGLSDPTIDHANQESISDTLYLGRVFPPEHLGTPFPPSPGRGPQDISHDIYKVTTGTWALALSGYPFTRTSVLSNYVGLNGGGTDVVDWNHSFLTLVDWAIGVSPYSDLIITKTATITEVEPGDRVTFTIRYTNTGLAAVENVTITDMLPTGVLTSVQVASWPSISASLGPPLVWTRPRLSYGQTGTLTITAQALLKTTLTNTVTITGLSHIGQPTPDRDLGNNMATIGPPCTDLTAITIAGATTGQPGTYTFTTTYEPTDATPPVAYLWDNGDTTPDSSRVLDVGNHTLVVTATNCAAALVTDSHTIVIPSPVTCTDLVTITIAGATTGQPGTYTFTTTYEPTDATPPVAYLWDNGDTTPDSSRILDVGTHTLVVTATNCAAALVTDSLTVEIRYQLYLPLVMRDW